MIKKIKTKDLKPGVFIHDFKCNSLNGNLLIGKKIIKDSKIIDILLSWDVNEVFIDTDRGDDISTTISMSAGSLQAKGQFHENDNVRVEPHKRFSVQSFYEEYSEAKVIAEEAVHFIEKSLEQIKKGKTPDFDQTYILVQKMQESLEQNSDALSLLSRIRNKDEYTLYHSLSVSALALNLCNHKGILKKNALDIAVGALFHDIGKTEIDENILNKPGKLSPQEFLQMKQHTRKSANILLSVKDLPPEVHDIALHHHERLDGTGYPDGLSGDQINFGAQLTSICDIFDAVTSDRCYRKGLGFVAGLKIVYDLRGKHLNENLTNDFIHCVGVYPVGSCVRLENGLAGVVVATTATLLKPVVKIFYDLGKKKRLKPFFLDLQEVNLSISSYEDPATLELTKKSLLQEIVRK